MKSSHKIHQALLNEWTVRIADQKSSGLTIRQWCEQNNLSIHKYNYWKHQLKEIVVDQVLPDIAPISLPAPSSLPSDFTNPMPVNTNCTNRTNRTNCSMVHLTINGIDISIDASVPETFLLSLIKAARYA